MQEFLTVILLALALVLIPLLVYFGLVPLLAAISGNTVPFIPALLTTYLFAGIAGQSVTK